MSVTVTRPVPYTSGDIRNGVQSGTSDALTDKGTGVYDPVPRTVTCRRCGTEIPPDGWVVVTGSESRERTFCWTCASDGCRSERGFRTYMFPWLTRSALNAGRTRDAYLHRCRRCQRWFVGAYVRQWCSHECGERIRNGRRDRTRDRDARPCVECGDTFTPPRADGRYCSGACRQKAYRARIGGGRS